MGISAGRIHTGGVVHLYAELWRFARGKRHLLVAACVLLILAQIVLLAVPYVAARAINALQLYGAAGLSIAGLWLSAVLLLALVSWTFHGPGRLLERNVSLRVRQKLSNALLEQLFALPLSWHEAHHSGATAHRVQKSSQALATFAESQFIYLNSGVRIIGPILALSCIDPLVGALCIAGFALISTSVLRFDRIMIRLATEENNAERKYAATLVDALGNAKTVFALRQGRSVIEMLERRLFEIFTPLKRAIVVNELKWLTVDLSTRILSGALVGLFAWHVTHATTTGATKALLLGNIYMVWEYALQAGGVVVSVAEHFQAFARQNADYASADAIRDSASSASAGRPAADPPTSWNQLDIRDLTFRHSAARSDGASLDRVALSLKCGKRYALIGQSGCGKSTLLRVLAGLYISEQVGIEFDATPIISSPSRVARLLRSCATLIPQDAEVFAGTIADNLRLCSRADNRPLSPDLTGALRVANVDFIDPTPVGLAAQMTESAANWSGGQRSRIALARGVLAAQGSSLILLDEPTAHLDPTSEAQVYANLFAEFPDSCIVSSLHRLHLLDYFDEVLLMKDGSIIAQGEPASLILACPEYGELSRRVPINFDKPTAVAA